MAIRNIGRAAAGTFAPAVAPAGARARARSGAASAGSYYATTFSGGSENPISEGGAWTTGADALSSVVRMAGGIAYGTQTGAESSEGPPRYNDSQAFLSGFPKNHRIEITISRTGSWSGDLEVELLFGWSVSGSLRSPQPTFGPTHSDGIECNLAISSSFGVFTGVARWLEVAVADFSSGPITGLLPIQDGDIFAGQLTLNDGASTGTVVTSIIRSGVETVLGTVTDATLYRVGQPGLGFFREDVGGTPDPTQYAATAYKAMGI